MRHWKFDHACTSCEKVKLGKVILFIGSEFDVKDPSSWGQFHQRSTSSFYAGRSQKHKKESKVVSLFCTLGSALAKAACRMMMTLTPVVEPL